MKCDEALPKCSFCARRSLECVRPNRPVRGRENVPVRQPDSARDSTYDGAGEVSRQQPTSPRTYAASGQTQPLTLPKMPSRATPSFDPFHSFPIAEAQYNPAMAPILKQFFGDIAATLSHDLTTVYFRLRLAFLADLHEDEAVFFSMVSYCAAFQVTVDSAEPLARLKLEAEKSTLSLLRYRIEERTVVTNATVLAAVMHVFLVTYDTIDGPGLRRMMNGVNTLARACKLTDVTTYTCMLLLCNVLCSLFNADEPCFQHCNVPPRPHSFNSVYVKRPPANVHELINEHLAIDVMMLFQDLDFVLFFRSSSEKFYSLSPIESFYMCELLKSIDVQLTTLQVRHLGDRSLDEIAVLGAILVKQEVVAHSMHQLSAIVPILKRLQQAILMHLVKAAGLSESLAMWSCFAALVGRGLESRRKWFSDFILAVLLERNKKGGLAHGWMFDLHLEMRQFPWHERIDVHCATMCEVFHRRHTYIYPMTALRELGPP